MINNILRVLFGADPHPHPDWMSIEKACAETKGLPDCVPSNAREWDAFIRQYERAVDLAEGRWHPHYDWEDEKEFRAAVNEQFYLGRGYKKSVYECLFDLVYERVLDGGSEPKEFIGLNWRVVETAFRFTAINVYLYGYDVHRGKLKFKRAWGNRVVPRKVLGSFMCNDLNIGTLVGAAPEWVGANFSCEGNKLRTLEGAPRYVGGNFNCERNKLRTTEGAPAYIGGRVLCDRNPLDADAKGRLERNGFGGVLPRPRT